MKRTLKKLLAAVSMMALVLVMTACSSAAGTEENSVPEAEAANYKMAAESLIAQVAAFSDEDIQMYLEQDDAFTTSALTSWMSVKDELGAYVSVQEQEVSAEDKIVTVMTKAEYEKGTATVEMILDTKAQAYTGMTFNVNYSLAVLMQRAGMNTVMGIGIVFLMLLFLSFVIGLFKYIAKIQSGAGKKEAQKAAADVKETPAAEIAEEELADDTELAAVIAAAIAAYEDTSADSFVVRSIKKSNKWRRA